jgi:predicted acylesterase/phospholipase RssA
MMVVVPYVRTAISIVMSESKTSPITMAISRSLPRLAAATTKVSSFGFSGAGFLAAYHLGVAKCLMEQEILSPAGVHSSASYPAVALTGVSAGAIVSAAVSAGVDPDDGLKAVMKVAQRTRAAGGYLDAFSPNCSLIDLAEEHLGSLIRDAVYQDEECFLERINRGSLLRIGLTDRRVFPPVGQNPKAACYSDTYASVDEVLAACVLSSYVPGITGPALGSLDSRYSAVMRAATVLQEMIAAGSVKKTLTGEPIQAAVSNSDESNDLKGETPQTREVCWDGGLVNAFPYIDKDTVIVSPLAATVAPNATINPSVEYDSSSDHNSTSLFRVNDRIQLHLTAANAHTLRCIAMSSEDDVLQSRFAQGHDNAYNWLQRHNLVTVHHHVA